MKPSIFSALSLGALFTGALWGQWSGTNPVWTNSNVGIGATAPSPGVKLQLGDYSEQNVLNITGFYTANMAPIVALYSPQNGLNLWFVQSFTNNYYALPFSTNYYYNDWIGFPPAIVGYYQTYRPLNGLPLPCTVTVPQQMVIGVQRGLEPTPYGSQDSGLNSLVITIGPSSVAVSRGGMSYTKNFSFPQ